MTMRSVPGEGYLVLGDISGYTAFLTGTEQDHAQAIMEDLITLILDHIQPPLKLIKLEGDAIFCYAPGSAFLAGERLLEWLETCYYDFSDYREAMHRSTTCRCAACRAIPTLDLKFFAHYGKYLIQRLGGMEDLAGADVILAHRLLKNHIAEIFGSRGYLFVTDACLAQVGLPLTLARHSEEYEHLGEVGGGVEDLKALWQARVAARREYIGPEDADAQIEIDLPAPPPVAWDYLVDPAKNIQAQHDLLSWDQDRDATGRLGQDSGYHCAHGAYASLHDYRDWRPFHYFTEFMRQSTEPPLPQGPPPMLLTYELSPLGDGQTHLTVRVRMIDREIAAHAGPAIQGMSAQVLAPVLARFKDLLSAEAAQWAPPDP